MQFPLTKDMFRNHDLTKDISEEFISVFAQAVNSHYYDAKRGENRISYVTGDIIKAVYEQIYNEKPGAEMAMMLYVTADYINDALQQGQKDAAITQEKGGVA